MDNGQNSGWICLHRKLLDNPIMLKSNYVAVWIYLLLNANFEDKEIIWNNKKITIKRGQFIGSLRKISQHFKIGIATVKYILDYFISEHMIEQSSNRRFTLFTIVNYERYQDKTEHSIEHKVNTSRTQGETTNNDNNINNNIFKAQVSNETRDSKLEKLKEEFKNIVAWINTTHNRRFSVSFKGKNAKAFRQFVELRKTFTLKDFETSFNKAYHDKYHVETNFNYLTPEFLTRPDKFERFLNAK